MSVFRIINTVDELVAATQDNKARYLIIRNDLKDVPSIKLNPFQSITGQNKGCTLKFKKGESGICLTKSNELRNLHIEVEDDRRAIYQDMTIAKFYTHKLNHIATKGIISFIVDDTFEQGAIDASFIHVASANTNALPIRPNRYDSDSLIGAFTVWNQSDKNSTIDISLEHFTCGIPTAPIKASGLLLWGSDELKGKVKASYINCGNMYIHADIPANKPDLVAAAFVNGFQVDSKQVTLIGEIITEGSNEMGIYNWGKIDRFSMHEDLITKGANSCAVINAGLIGKMNFMAKIETHGTGARGLYMYDGHIADIHFEDVITHGDASTAIQFSRHIDNMTIDGNVEAFGDGLNVKLHDGTIVKVSADAIGVKYGGSVRLLRCSGDLITHGAEVRTIYDEASIERMFVQGKVIAKGEKSVAMEVNQGYFGGENINFISEKWAAVRVESAKVNNTLGLNAKGNEFDLLIDILSSVDRNIFAKEFLGGVFQDDVVIEYIDNLSLPKDEAPESLGGLKPSDEEDISKN